MLETFCKSFCCRLINVSDRIMNVLVVLAMFIVILVLGLNVFLSIDWTAVPPLPQYHILFFFSHPQSSWSLFHLMRQDNCRER